MNKVSIIIPVYNAEKTIAKCLESLINQTYQNLEIIVINDGSTDKTDAIIKKYHDKRLNYIKRTNSGIGITRNIGIEKATGDYLMFIDADDYLDLKAIEILVNNALTTKADLVVFNYILVTKSRNINITIPEFKPSSLKENPDLLININMSPWNKLYKKSLFKTNRFIVGLKYEDGPTTIQALIDAKKISYVKDYLYYYVTNPQGETLTKDKRTLDILKICDIIKDKTKDYPYLNTTKLFVKILVPFLKISRFIKDYKLRNTLIKEIYAYLDNTDKNWIKYLDELESDTKKRIIVAHKLFLKSYCNLYSLIK